jgi:hypothetical protein
VDWLSIEIGSALPFILSVFTFFPTYMVIDGKGIIERRLQGLDSHATVVHTLKEALAQMPELEGEERK